MLNFYLVLAASIETLGLRHKSESYSLSEENLYEDKSV